MLRHIVRSGAIAAFAALAFAAIQPAEAAGGRAETRAKAVRPAAPVRAAAAPAVRPAVTATRRPMVIMPNNRASRATSGPRVAAAPRATIRTTIRTAARGPERAARGHVQARAGGRREAYRAADRRGGFVLASHRPALQGRSGLRMVSLFSSPAAASTLPARGWKSGKPAAHRAYEVGESRSGVWHAGLPAADGEQMDCPAGTMAVLARGHSDTFRCMPM